MLLIVQIIEYYYVLLLLLKTTAMHGLSSSRFTQAQEAMSNLHDILYGVSGWQLQLLGLGHWLGGSQRNSGSCCLMRPSGKNVKQLALERCSTQQRSQMFGRSAGDGRFFGLVANWLMPSSYGTGPHDPPFFNSASAGRCVIFDSNTSSN